MKGTRKLFISVLALVVTLAMAATSTFAWFTVNDKATVESVTVDVKSGQGLYVKITKLDDSALTPIVGTTDGIGGYVSEIPTEAIIATTVEQADNTSIIPFGYKMDLVSTANGYSFFTAGAIGNKVTTADTAATANTMNATTLGGTQISFKLTFMSDKAGWVYLADGSEISVGDTAPAYVKAGAMAGSAVYDTGAESGVTFATAGTDVAVRAAYAARVSFSQPLTGEIVTPGFVRVFDMGSGITPSDATNVQIQYYKQAIGWANYDVVTDSLGTKVPYTATTLGTDVLTGNQLTAAAAVGAANDLDNGIVKLALNETTQLYEATVIVNIWLDGNDSVALNSILGDAFKVALAFEVMDVEDFENLE